MDQAGSLIGALSTDPSLRGVLGALNYGLIGVANGAYSLDALARPMTLAADTVDDVLADRPAHFSWRVLASGKPAEPGDLRRFIQVQPVLDFHSLEPGHAATAAVTAAAQRLNLDGDYQARVRQTGLVPMNDAQFGALKEHAGLNAAVSLGAVLLILWLALRSWRIILAAAVSLFCRLGDLGRARPVPGRHPEPDFGRVFRAVRRARRRFRHPVRGALPRRAARVSASCGRRWSAPPARPARPWRWLPPRPRSASSRSCRPPIAACRNWARSPGSA